MNVVIIEDEYPAAERLERMLERADPAIQVSAVLESVEAAVDWLRTEAAPDLILSDIQLSDGLSFEIYEQVLVQRPIIFTTSYDEYAIRAFKHKSIDYLLKPIKFEELQRAIQKYRDLQPSPAPTDHAARLEKLLDTLSHSGRTYKKRFLVKKGEQLIPVADEAVAYLYTENELVYLITREDKKYVVDYTLEQLDGLLDPTRFFRINRQFIVGLAAVQQIHTYFSSRLKLHLQPAASTDVVVSKGQVKGFKAWLEGAVTQ
ncbi:MAG: LytTR family DNA-binding domain-containing protein [Tunicatimonas sp.]